MQNSNSIKDFSKDLVKKTLKSYDTSRIIPLEERVNGLASECVTEDELNSKGYLVSSDISEKADRSELHSHSNKSVLDSINQDKINAWDKAILYHDSAIANANDWKTTGYKRTSNNTTNLPSQCSSASDKWGVLFLIKENTNMGTQLFFPIDGNYRGRVFVRPFFRDGWGDWNLLSTFSGSYNDLTNKPTIPSIEGLATEEHVASKVAELVNSAPETLDTLQELANALGNDPNFATTVSNQIGTKASTKYVNEELDKKVNVEGFVATENSYTTQEKTKLEGIENNANNYVHPVNHNASIITEDETHRFVTDAEKESWNNKLSSIPSEYITETELNSKGYLVSGDIENKADRSELHEHNNKSVLDEITSGKITNWDKSIPFENRAINDANEWLTTGFIKTSPSTINLPSQCSTSTDKWGVLQFLKESDQGSGCQLFYPIDGSYKGRVFVRSIIRQQPNSWTLLSTFSGSYNDLTNKPVIPSIEGFATKKYVDDKVQGIQIPDLGVKIWTGTKTEYDAISEKDATTLYFVIKEELPIP